MTRVTSLRRLAHAASAGIALVCLLTIWTSHVYQPADTDAAVNMSLYSNLLLLITGVVYLTWLGRARRNLMEFKGEERAYGPGWTIGAWIIPIANLIMPPLVTADIARGSTTDATTRRKLVVLVWVWWVCYVGNAVSLFGVNDPDPFNPAQLLGTASYTAAGVLVIVLMYKVTQAQRERFAAITEPDPADFPTFTVDDVKAVEAD